MTDELAGVRAREAERITNQRKAEHALRWHDDLVKALERFGPLAAECATRPPSHVHSPSDTIYEYNAKGFTFGDLCTIYDLLAQIKADAP